MTIGIYTRFFKFIRQNKHEELSKQLPSTCRIRIKKFSLRNSFRVSSNRGARGVKLASHLRSIGDQFRPRGEDDLRTTYCESSHPLFLTIGDSVCPYIVHVLQALLHHLVWSYDKIPQINKSVIDLGKRVRARPILLRALFPRVLTVISTANYALRNSVFVLAVRGKEQARLRRRSNRYLYVYPLRYDFFIFFIFFDAIIVTSDVCERVGVHTRTHARSVSIGDWSPRYIGQATYCTCPDFPLKVNDEQ